MAGFLDHPFIKYAFVRNQGKYFHAAFGVLFAIVLSLFSSYPPNEIFFGALICETALTLYQFIRRTLIKDDLDQVYVVDSFDATRGMTPIKRFWLDTVGDFILTAAGCLIVLLLCGAFPFCTRQVHR